MTSTFIENNKIRDGDQVAIVKGVNFDPKMIGITNYTPKKTDFTVYFFRNPKNLK